MSKANKPAFPINLGAGDYNNGLTKREYFAAMAMQGLLSAGGLFGHLDGHNDDTMNASFAVRYADALLAELEKE